MLDMLDLNKLFAIVENLADKDKAELCRIMAVNSGGRQAAPDFDWMSRGQMIRHILAQELSLQSWYSKELTEMTENEKAEKEELALEHLADEEFKQAIEQARIEYAKRLKQRKTTQSNKTGKIG